MNGSLFNLDRNKQFLIASVSIALVLFFIIARFSVKDTPKRPEGLAASAGAASDSSGVTFLTGRQWRGIDALDISSADKLEIKASLLKVTIETGIINSNPLITVDRPLLSYLGLVDSVYQNEADLDIPIAFALKVADMTNRGMPVDTIERYKTVVLQKLDNIRLIEN